MSESDSDPAQALRALLDLMARLRDAERGCPWDRAQTFATIAPYTIEEAYEVADAIERGDPQSLRDELGDLLFQVVFHARMAQERGWFDFAQVAQAIRDKLVRRHPHVFADVTFASAAEQSAHWEELKARERAEAARQGATQDDSVLAAIPKGLPALTRAEKLGKRAARVGFDWSHARDVRAKVDEELAELDAALAESAGDGAPDRERVMDEFGDVLFAMVNWSRHLRIDPETALRQASAKFERRFRRMEQLARERGCDLTRLSAAEWDALWVESKAFPSASS